MLFFPASPVSRSFPLPRASLRLQHRLTGCFDYFFAAFRRLLASSRYVMPASGILNARAGLQDRTSRFEAASSQPIVAAPSRFAEFCNKEHEGRITL